jgi:DNA-binding NarL/FixJ family response regulator
VPCLPGRQRRAMRACPARCASGRPGAPAATTSSITRPARPPAPATARLPPPEPHPYQIAGLVASGRRNRAIAEELSLNEMKGLLVSETFSCVSRKGSNH